MSAASSNFLNILPHDSSLISDVNEGTSVDSAASSGTTTLTSSDNVFSSSVYAFLPRSSNDASCPHCGKCFASSRGLSIHVGKTHQDSSRTSVSFSTAPVLLPASSSSLVHSNSNALKSSLSETKKLLSRLKSSIPLLRRVPRGARSAVAEALHAVISQAVRTNDVNTWMDIFFFPYAVLRVPQQSDHVTNLTTWVKQGVRCWLDNHRDAIPCPSTKRRKTSSSTDSFNIKMVENKIVDGDIRGAVRLLTSDDIVVTPDANILKDLKKKTSTSI